MSSGQKVALSFLSALVFFAVFVFFGQTKLMSTIETKFYAQSKIAQKQDQLDKLSESCNTYISNILKKIQTDEDSYLNSSAVKSYAVQNPSEKDEVDRRNLTSSLFDTFEGLEGIRLIESTGRSIHFSSFETDVLKTEGLKKSYKNYPNVKEELNELDVDLLLTDATNPSEKIYLDTANNRLIVSFPFFITEKTSFGTLVCYFSIYDFEQYLINNQLLQLGEHFELLNDNGISGFVTGVPGDGKTEFKQAVASNWKKGTGKSFQQIVQQTNGTTWLLITSKNNEYISVGGVYKNSLFELPLEFIYLIYICVFITLLLIFFLLFSLKRDYLIKVKQRIKKVQLGIINEYLENKQQIEWSQIARQLEYRKEELSLEIKKSVGGKNKKYEKIVDAYLEQSWSEIINVINSQNKNQISGLSGASIEEIRKVMEEVLKTAKLNVSMSSAGASKITEVPSSVDDVEEIEEIEEIEDAEDLDEVEEIEEIEEISDAEELEEVEDLEDAIEDVEELDDVEEIDDAEPVEELDDVEEAEAVEEIDEIEDVEEAEEVEEIEDAETADEAEELEDIEIEKDAAGAEELEELTDADDEIIEELTEEISAIQTDISNDFSYIVSDKTFSSSKNDDFASCDTVFAEDLCIGNEYVHCHCKHDKDFTFTVYIPDFTPKSAMEDVEDAEELEPSGSNFFSMTSFGANDIPVSELLEEENDSTIVENKGIYSISKNVKPSDEKLNMEFKELVDSVLHTQND